MGRVAGEGVKDWRWRALAAHVHGGCAAIALHWHGRLLEEWSRTAIVGLSACASASASASSLSVHVLV